MKQVTAYIRAELATRAVEGLKAAQEAQSITLLHPRGDSERRADCYSASVSLGEGLPPLARLKILCADLYVPALVALVRRLASTGRKGDGMIFVSKVGEPVWIVDEPRASDVILV